MGKNIGKYYYYLDYKNYYWNTFKKKKNHKYKLITSRCHAFPHRNCENATDFTFMKRALTRFETPLVAYVARGKQNKTLAMRCNA